MANRRLTFGLVGGTLGTIVGLLIGLLVVRNDEATPPRTELVPVSLPAVSTTVAPTPPTGDTPLAVAPSDTSMSSSASTEPTSTEVSTPTTVAIAHCEEYARLPEGLPVQICDRSETVRLVQEMLSALGYQIVADVLDIENVPKQPKSGLITQGSVRRDFESLKNSIKTGNRPLAN